MDHPTPEIDLQNDDEEYVYLPSDDTFLMLDALQDDREDLLNLSPSICLEIGSGSGCLTAFLSNLLNNIHTAFYLAVDINPRAASVSQRTFKLNGLKLVDVINTDLLAGLEQRLEGKVDVLLFNPPYVPTESHEIQGTGIEVAWAGGQFGREVTDRALPSIMVFFLFG
eukprot:TRINITY_DN1531_c0_g1_i2.p1 TRINITY_DN1531_c0_g1~~TRINITY_DN1531_c0_g1_i2.p1  ORF type:complete len:168 (-),score=31.84 TRINITY_DN1531_c0_g1_i2:59-562(-)